MSDDKEKSREGKSDNDNNKSVNKLNKNNFVVNLNDENKKFENTKNFCDKNKSVYILHTQVIFNNVKNNSQIIFQNSNPESNHLSSVARIILRTKNMITTLN
jgi:hypothetical protein